MRACTVLARTEALILRTGTFSATLNAEWDTPPAGIKRRDGRLNYYTTHLYRCTCSRPFGTPVREHLHKSPLVPALARASTPPVRPLLLLSAQVKGCLGVAGVLEPRGPT